MDRESRREAPSKQHMTQARSRSDRVRKAQSAEHEQTKAASRRL